MKEYISIQYLRGVAAMMVVLFHVGVPLGRMGYSGGWPMGLSGGVDIFFVISGFVMWTSTRDRAMTPSQFWWKRIVRIVPLYWLVTTFVVATLIVKPTILKSSVFDLPHILTSYLFVPYNHPLSQDMMPVLIPGWTLNYEMFFYLIFGCFLLVRPSVRLIATSVALLMLVMAGLVFQPVSDSFAGFYTSSIILEFAAGMVLGAWVHNNAARSFLSRLAGVLLILLGFTALLALPSNLDLPRGLVRGIPAVAIVMGALAIEARGGVKRHWLPYAIGDASYSIYLSQMITMAAFYMAWRALNLDRLPGNLLLYAIADTLFAALAGYVCHRLVEKPLSTLLRPRNKPLMRTISAMV